MPLKEFALSSMLCPKNKTVNVMPKKKQLLAVGDRARQLGGCLKPPPPPLLSLSLSCN
jgi:hypothetical protein